MREQLMREFVHAVIQETGFQPDAEAQMELRKFYDSSKDEVRRANLKGEDREGRPAVLVVYDDGRKTRFAEALADFHASNRSTTLTAPRLYAHKEESPSKGWLIMERVEGKPFPNPAFNPEARRQLLDLYRREYEANWPVQPSGRKFLDEELPAANAAQKVLAGWFKLAEDKEDELAVIGEQTLVPSEFLPLYVQAMRQVHDGLYLRNMEYGHGLFYHANLLELPDGRFCLVNFLRAGMRPEGADLVMMLWASVFQRDNYPETVEEFEAEVRAWMDDLAVLAEEMEYEKPKKLIRVSMIGRVLATILADICATDKPTDVKKHKLSYLMPLLKELLA